MDFGLHHIVSALYIPSGQFKNEIAVPSSANPEAALFISVRFCALNTSRLLWDRPWPLDLGVSFALQVEFCTLDWTRLHNEERPVLLTGLCWGQVWRRERPVTVPVACVPSGASGEFPLRCCLQAALGCGGGGYLCLWAQPHSGALRGPRGLSKPRRWWPRCTACCTVQTLLPFFFFNWFLLENSCLALLCFLLYSEVNQPYIDTGPLFLDFLPI